MTNVKFFDKNGVELNVGDVVLFDGSENKLTIRRMQTGIHDVGIAWINGHESPFVLHCLTKHTPKLIKIKRTFEEVCELVKQECLFKTSGSCLSIYNPVIDVNDNSIRVAYITVSAWLFKPKNSDTWQELEFKEVEE